jgi:hypothetical protein
MRGDNIKMDLKEIWCDTVSWTKLVMTGPNGCPQLSKLASYRHRAVATSCATWER